MSHGAVRIIGGVWRGQKIAVTAPAVKPTPSRVRETLFNWLAPNIKDAYCLDLFAGSGALGFEALSRGAAHVSFVERAFPIIKMLKNQVMHFQASAKTHIYHSSFAQLSYQRLQDQIQTKTFDVIFLDPPFKKNLLEPTLQWLENEAPISPKTWIYMEHEKDIKLPDYWLTQWRLWRQKQAGQVYYELWRKD